MSPSIAAIIEDDEILAEIVSGICSQNDLTPIVYRNGFDALAGLQDIRPRILITDLGMPTVNGRVLLDTIAEDPYGLTDIPIVVLTGDSSAHELVGRHPNLKLRVLLKPRGIQDLAGILREI